MIMSRKRSYQSDHIQLFLHDQVTDCTSVDNDVPQGSILGPLLFSYKSQACFHLILIYLGIIRLHVQQQEK